MILSSDNRAVNLEASIDSDLHYTVMDFAEEIDFLCPPLLFLESPRKPLIGFEVHGCRVVLPHDWTILVGDRDQGEMTFLRLLDVIEHRHTVILLNPFTSRLCSYDVARLVDRPKSVLLPRSPQGKQALVIPVEIRPEPLCLIAGKPHGSLHFEAMIADLL